MCDNGFARRLSAAILVFGLWASIAAAVDLEPGDVVAIAGGGIVHVDPVSGVQTLITQGDLLDFPISVVVDPRGRIFVADASPAKVIEVDAATGAQTQVSAGTIPAFAFNGISLDANGDFVTTDQGVQLIRVDRATGTEQVLSASGSFQLLVDVEVEDDGMILALDATAGKLFRVDPTTGAQSEVWGSLVPGAFPRAMAPGGVGSVFIVGIGGGGILRIDTTTGAESVVSTDSLASGIGMDATEAGLIYLADASNDRIVRIDSVSGAVGILSSANLLVSPQDVAVVPPLACDPTPAPACVSAGKATFSVKKRSVPAADSLVWKLKKGTVSLADFGAPEIDTSFALCVYADGRLAMSKVVEAAGACNGKPCWRALGTRGFKYKDRDGSGAGITRVVLKEGTGKASLLVKGKGANLNPVLPLGVGTGGALVQLIRFEGTECWESSFATFLRNDSGSFKAKF